MEACFTSFLFGVYLRSISPSIAGGDAGELVAEACHLGVAHPPGYPIFILITHLVTKKAAFLGKTEAFRANLVSAACDALACLLISIAFQRLACCNQNSKSEDRWLQKIVGCCFGALYGLSPLVWQYSVTAEVFAMNNLFAALILWATLEYTLSEKPFRSALLGAFLCGLGLCNQHTLLLLELPVVAWVLFTLLPHCKSPVKAVLSLAAMFFLGLTPYAYLVMSMRLRPQQGSWGDTTTLSGFFHHLRRADYGSFQLYSGDKKSQAEPLLERLVIYWKDLWERQGLWGYIPIMAAVGAFWILLQMFQKNENSEVSTADSKQRIIQQNSKGKKTKKAAVVKTKSKVSKTLKEKDAKENGGKTEEGKQKPDLRQSTVKYLLLVCLAFYLVVFHSLSNLPLHIPILYGVHQRFWMQPNQLVFLIAAVGLLQILSWMSTILRSRIVIRSLGLLCTVFPIYFQLTHWFDLNDQSESKWFDYYARSILEQLPPNSIMVTNYDQQWTSLRYLHVCEGVGVDKNITVLHLSMMSYRWWETKRSVYQKSGVAFPNVHYGQRHDRTAFTWKDFLDANYDAFPGGIYLGGRLTHPDSEYKSTYEMIPYGFVERAMRIHKVPSVLKWQKESQKIWKEIFKMFPPLPPVSKYSEETWEFTIIVEFMDHLQERGAYLLERALEYGAGKKGSLKAITEAAWWLEHVLVMDERHGASTYKNLGLAYLNLVRTKEFDDTVPLSGFKGGLSVPNMSFSWPEGPNWKTWASARFVECWTTFVEREDAKSDLQYESVKGILNQVLQATKQSPVS